MRFSADARLAIGTLADFSGELARLDDGFAATLETLRIRQDARLGHASPRPPPSPSAAAPSS